MTWTVDIHNSVAKQLPKLPAKVMDRLKLLLAEIEAGGPVRHNWKNYSRLEGKKRRHHCHIRGGRPTYVAVWEEKDKSIQLVEVQYVGTHEKAPY
jgi:hypothetical protein